MGWLDKLKDWAEDAVEEAVETVEETVDDAGSWVEEKFQDLRRRQQLDGNRRQSGRPARRERRRAAEHRQGRRSQRRRPRRQVHRHRRRTRRARGPQDAWNTVKDAAGDGGGLLDQIGGGNVAEVLGKPAGSTFGEQAWNQVTDLFGAGTATPASPADPGMGTAGPASPLGPAAATTTAQSLGQPAADTGDDILGRGIVPPHLDPAQQAPSAGAGVRPDRAGGRGRHQRAGQRRCDDQRAGRRRCGDQPDDADARGAGDVGAGDAGRRAGGRSGDGRRTGRRNVPVRRLDGCRGSGRGLGRRPVRGHRLRVLT